MKSDDNAQAPVTDDAELAKVLEGMNGQKANVTNDLQFEEAPIPAPQTPAADTSTPADDTSSDNTAAAEPVAPAQPAEEPTIPEPVVEEPAAPELPTPVTTSPVSEPTLTTAAPSGLDSIKKDALSELRPLVDKLTLPADEKFDTLLLIIRSTDDQSLIPAAHDAAKGIEDEGKRAQALLDIIKEIDYFSAQGQSQ